jgi:hypothetical protein
MPLALHTAPPAARVRRSLSALLVCALWPLLATLAHAGSRRANDFDRCQVRFLVDSPSAARLPQTGDSAPLSCEYMRLGSILPA